MLKTCLLNKSLETLNAELEGFFQSSAYSLHVVVFSLSPNKYRGLCGRVISGKYPKIKCEIDAVFCRSVDQCSLSSKVKLFLCTVGPWYLWIKGLLIQSASNSGLKIFR